MVVFSFSEANQLRLPACSGKKFTHTGGRDSHFKVIADRKIEVSAALLPLSEGDTTISGGKDDMQPKWSFA